MAKCGRRACGRRRRSDRVARSGSRAPSLLGKEQTGGRQPNGRSRPNRPWRSVQWESLRQAKVTWDGLPFTFDMRGVEAIKVGCTVA